MFIANSKQIARRSSLFATKSLALQYLFALNQISGFTKSLALQYLPSLNQISGFTKNLVLQYLPSLNQISGFTKNLVLRPTFASSARPPHFDMDAGGRQRQLLLFQLACL
jgi:hypothetical protein